jgi:hypothetical protein
MAEEIINRVKNSPLVTIDLEEVLDKNTGRNTIDLKEVLFQGMILREKDFRGFVKDHDWSQYAGQYVNIHCSADAIIPNWAFMIVASKLHEFAKLVVYGDEVELEKEIIRSNIDQMNLSDYEDGKIVIKGCSDIKNPDFAFTYITNRLMPYVSSIMYGEPCSTVPVYKRRKK